ncbi:MULTISPECIES: hypothetical protein [unclassified Synechococcus]|uniref:hypothetical protein n=1 Tax=unclassified Synechococcus TaxID=2626047 RepID=UPI001C226C68|nr:MULTISPECIES: hypothetical protein [unclassified Synechococcus]
MNTNETHPVELLLLAGLVVAEALIVLVAAAVALVLTITRSRPAGSPARVMTPPPTTAPPPAVHPLAMVAEQLEGLPVSRLRPMVGTRSKRIRKAELVALAVAC